MGKGKSGRSKRGTPRKTAPTRDTTTRKALGDGGSLTSLTGGSSKPDRFSKYKGGV